MRFLTWCLGILVLLQWHWLLLLHGAALPASYIAALIFWIFAGAGVCLTGIIRLVAGKMKAGVLKPVSAGGPGAPATQKGD
jgi:hypothetical protein